MMPVLPIPMIIALLLLGFLIHRLVTRETHATLLALIAACALQSAIIALVQYYGFTAIRPLQPILATLIPPIAWFAFARASGGEGQSHTLAWHGIAPALAVVFLLTSPMLLDVLIPLSFAGYGAAMLLRLWQGEDSLPHSRLQGGATPLLAWRIIAVSLIASAGCDVLIAYNLAMGQNAVLHWVPSLVSSLSLLSLGALGLSHAIESQRDDPADDVSPSQADLDRDQAIIARLDDYVAAQRPFVDPDLTLARLARKLTVPAKQLSAAINRIKGENVSRYINRQRIEDACRILLEGQSVTNAMLDSGFNTKSNFNREFLRVKGASPSKWLQDQKSLLKSPKEAPKSVILSITESRFK
ncbi:helix-turn-helix domain-containing protein [Aestuariivirga sp.]|uniref:AraC family transcriptional regulator n=1 Tax=Aestuariivirga sp. TaxID=2650926 RepID=UPI00359376D5